MAKKTPPRIPPRFADTEDGPGTGRLVLPKGAPCDHCGKPVRGPSGNIIIVLEPEDGHPYLSVQHGRCAERQAEVENRRTR